jgi:hypothetical protein
MSERRETRLADVEPRPNWLAWPPHGQSAGHRFVLDSTWGYESGGPGGHSISGEFFVTDTLDGGLIKHRYIGGHRSQAKFVERAHRVRTDLVELCQILNTLTLSERGQP